VSALEWIGFNNETAEKIISHYASRPDPDQNPDELLDYVYSHVRGKSQQQDRPAIETMASMGLRQDFQNALTDPRFESIQGTETLRFWIEDTLRINYLTMIVLQGRLKKTAELIKAGKKKGKRASLPHAASIFQPEASSSQSPSTTATLSMTAANQSIPEQHNLPATYVSVEAAGPILHDHVVLYKARAACDMEDLILEDGRFNLSSLQTYSGGDFNHLRGAWYWTPERECAETYREWVERRCPWSETWVIRIQAPKACFNTLKHEELWYGYDWKEYLWHCRKKRPPPSKYDKFWESADLVKGHICTKVSSVVLHVKKEKLQTAITDDFVMTLAGGAKATQWVFMKDTSFGLILEQALGKTHIDITQALQMQGDSETKSP